ncbi:MAG TPA: hypothetical protein VIG24_12000 [Acidimicrobiia bacterium]
MSLENLPQLSEATVDGTGVFDVLMRATSAHLEQEFQKSRIRGPEYSQVYLGSLQAVMSASLQFLLQKENAELQNALLEQQILTEVQQTAVALAQKCKLDAEFDVLMLTKDKIIAETALLNQKRLTEQAQTVGAGVDADSVIGKQKDLFQRQSDGFIRDAEQKAAKALIDTWNVRRTTDSGTVADLTNQLDDATIGRMVEKLLTGVNA